MSHSTTALLYAKWFSYYAHHYFIIADGVKIIKQCGEVYHIVDVLM